MINKKNAADENNKIFQYKGRNLIRCGKVLCYGNANEDKVVLMEIMDDGEKLNDINISNRVSVALFNREDLLKSQSSTFVSHCERSGLYDALEIADLWLSNNNSKE